MPHNLGLIYITREEVIHNHAQQLARNLKTDRVTSNPSIHFLREHPEKFNVTFALRSYSFHKHMPLVKLTMVVTTSGFILSVLGIYLAVSKNRDANILKHTISQGNQDLPLKKDVFVVNRGYRDA